MLHIVPSSPNRIVVRQHMVVILLEYRPSIVAQVPRDRPRVGYAKKLFSVNKKIREAGMLPLLRVDLLSLVHVCVLLN